MKQVIQIDTRERNVKHITEYFNIASDIIYFESKLFIGDYCNLSANPFRVIERKNSIMELCSTLGKEHVRFRNELQRANSYGFEVILLVESEKCTCAEDIKDWVNPYSKMEGRCLSGEVLYKILNTLMKNYNLSIEFTSKADCGAKILQLLNAK